MLYLHLSIMVRVALASLPSPLQEGEFSEAREDLAMRMPISGIYKIKVSVMSLQVSSNMVS